MLLRRWRIGWPHVGEIVVVCAGRRDDMWEIPKTSIIALHRVKNESNDEGARDKIRTKTLRTVTQPINKEY